MEEFSAPYSWLRKINQGLLQLDKVPLMQTPIDFIWEEFTKHLTKQLQIEHLSIELSDSNWRSDDDILSGLGDNLIPLAFSFAPLEGHVYWIMSEDDIAKLSSYILLNKNAAKTFSSTLLQEGYYRFLALETLQVLEEMDFFNELSAKIVENVEQTETDALCLDIKLGIANKSIWGRLCITPSFVASWEKFFASQFTPLKILKKSFEAPLLIEVGNTKLPLKSLKELEKGDFILLDHINWDPITHKGMIKILLGNVAIFLAKVKPNGIKIVDYAFYQEENSMIEEENNLEHSIPEEIEEELSEEKTQVTPLETAAGSLSEIDTILTVETARFRISLEKLLQLQPGNLLELPIQPHQRVNLSVNGQIIGHGELVHLGEVLGVKISDINK